MVEPKAFSFIFDSPVGPLVVTVRASMVCGIDLPGKSDHGNRMMEEDAELKAEIAAQLRRYFSTGDDSFSLPLNMMGTPFQQRVWQQLRSIPSGETRTYGEIARRLGSSARAVGNACRRNPVPVIVPCHRVVSAAGLGGFSGQVQGDMLDIKRWLLKHEGVIL
ncbi:MAG: methylated-DNA--[protein]-cysteine S-methyltransferase [Sedimenticola sp.]